MSSLSALKRDRNLDDELSFDKRTRADDKQGENRLIAPPK
jgi:hypothetical protein